MATAALSTSALLYVCLFWCPMAVYNRSNEKQSAWITVNETVFWQNVTHQIKWFQMNKSSTGQEVTCPGESRKQQEGKHTQQTHKHFILVWVQCDSYSDWDQAQIVLLPGCFQTRAKHPGARWMPLACTRSLMAFNLTYFPVVCSWMQGPKLTLAKLNCG